MDDGERCDEGDDNSRAPSACRPDCTRHTCGDAIVDLDESCDDGNTEGGDGCNLGCQIEFCGDRVVNNAGAEQCDDGNAEDGDGCTANCAVEHCGDGVVNNLIFEQCDEGEGNSDTEPDTCRLDCTVPGCGDGVLDTDETCDDGNIQAGDGCSLDCQIEFCGDGVVNNNGVETCDDGNDEDDDGCNPDCVLEFCGDGLVNNGDEACDEGPLNSDEAPDACRTGCVLPTCGDGTTDTDEGCDDDNIEDNDGCSSACVIEFCGDGIANNGDETCDDANEVEGDGCNLDCQIEFCGDGVVNNNGVEQCDEGDENSDELPGACRLGCRLPRCGDGIEDPGESCDDGNNTNGDGCGSACYVEICGDGLLHPALGEVCDDGNGLGGDGCAPGCTLECGDGQPGALAGPIETIELVWLAAACPEEVRPGTTRTLTFSLGGTQIHRTEVDGECGCEPGVRTHTITDPGLLGLLRSGWNTASVAAVGAELSWALARLGEARELVLFDHQGGRDALDQNPDKCDAGALVGGAGEARFFREACDDGNNEEGDGCSATCDLEVCANGVIDFGEECDDGNDNDGDGCSGACLLEACGDGQLDGGEGCDDGGTEGGDGCSALCRVEVCGNGVLDIGEACDDNNTSGGDGCSRICGTEVCGNGVLDIGEACDDGNEVPDDGCSALCLLEGCVLGSDTDNDGLDDCHETLTGRFVSPLDTGTDPESADTDGDGIFDGEEVFGTFAGLNLPAMGASPVHKDLFIEIDWFNDARDCAQHSHKPGAAAIEMVVAMFDRAPVNNPDGVTGINLHIDVGQGRGFDEGTLIPVEEDNLVGRVDGEFLGYKRDYHAPERHGIFHYVLAVHSYDGTSSSGWGEINGDDFILASHCWHRTDLWVAGTIAHELGHNLGLHHGGRGACNYKPNFNSIMSYRFQFSGRDDDCDGRGDGIIDYSRGLNASLDENNLDESLGICGGRPIDWNGDDTLESGVVEDINSQDRQQSGACGGTLTTLDDHNDWAFIKLSDGLSDNDGGIPPLVAACGPAPSHGGQP